MDIKEFLSKEISFFRYVTDEDRVFIPRRELYGFIEVKAENASDAARLAKLVWDGILEEYKKNERMKPSDALKLALKYGEKTLKELIRKDKQFGTKGVDLNYALILFSENKIYATNFGETKIILTRGEKSLDVSEVIAQKSGDIVSTYMYSTDMVLVGTSKEIVRIMKRKKVDIESVAAVGVDAIDKDSGGVVLFAESIQYPVKEEQEEEIVEVVEKTKVKEEQIEDQEEIRNNTADELSESSQEESRKDQEARIIGEEKEANKEEVQDLQSLPDTDKDSPAESKKELAIARAKTATTAVSTFVKKNYPVVKDRVGKIAAGIAEILGNAWEKIKAGVGSLLDNKFGRELWFKKFKQTISNITYRFNKRDVKGMKVDGYRRDDKKKKIIGYVIMSLIASLLLYTGYRWTANRSMIKEANEEISQDLLEVEALILEAERTVMSDVSNSQNKLSEAQTLYSTIKSREFIPDTMQLTLEEMEKRVLEADDKVSRKTVLTEDEKNIELFVVAKINFQDDTELQDIAYHRAASGAENLFLLDYGTNTLYKISLRNKSITKVPDPANLLTDPLNVRAHSTGVYILDRKEGVLRAMVDDAGNAQNISRISGLEANKIDPDNIADFEVWSQERMFSLVPSDGRIYMYSISRGLYGQAVTRLDREYVVDGRDIFADEINVYGAFAGSDGLKRFKLDRNTNLWGEDNLSLEGVYPAMQNIKHGYASDKNLYVYLYEEGAVNGFTGREENKIVMLTKPDDNGSMVMQKQYVYRGALDSVFSDVRNIVVDNSDNYAYVLDGENVWMIDLKKN